MVSSFPETTRLYMIVMWLGLPIATFFIARSWTYPPGIFQLRAWGVLKLLGITLFLLAFLGFFLVFFADVSTGHVRDHGGRGGAMVKVLTEFRLGLAFFGSAAFVMVALLTGLMGRLLYLLAVKPKPGTR